MIWCVPCTFCRAQLTGLCAADCWLCQFAVHMMLVCLFTASFFLYLHVVCVGVVNLQAGRLEGAGSVGMEYHCLLFVTVQRHLVPAGVLLA